MPATADPVRTFNLRRALANWRAAYPDEEERIRELRKEYWSCRLSEFYPATTRNIERMLEVLES